MFCQKKQKNKTKYVSFTFDKSRQEKKRKSGTNVIQRIDEIANCIELVRENGACYRSVSLQNTKMKSHQIVQINPKHFFLFLREITNIDLFQKGA
jgi:hypothetical protein